MRPRGTQRRGARTALRQARTGKYGARGHGSVARGGIQRIEVADDYNTWISGHHPRPVHPAQRAGAHR